MKRILFVCTGNTCRSCMTEAIFNTLAAQDPSLAESFTAISAGLGAYEGESASRNAVSALKEAWDIDIGAHKSRQATQELFEEAWLVLTMTRAHKEAILSAFPHLKGKVFTLREYNGGDKTEGKLQDYDYSLDIGDPYGMPLHIYKLCAADIRKEVELLLARLLRI